MKVQRWLPCGDCGVDAIPELPDGGWSEDQEGECPECGVWLYAYITGDGVNEWMEAMVRENDE